MYSHWMKSNPTKIPRGSRMAWISETLQQQKGHSLFFGFLWHTRDPEHPELSFISGKKHDGVRLDLHALAPGDHVWLALHGRTLYCDAGIHVMCPFTNVVPKCTLQFLLNLSWPPDCDVGVAVELVAPLPANCDQCRSKWGSFARGGIGDNGALREFQAKDIPHHGSLSSVTWNWNRRVLNLFLNLWFLSNLYLVV